MGEVLSEHLDIPGQMMMIIFMDDTKDEHFYGRYKSGIVSYQIHFGGM